MIQLKEKWLQVNGAYRVVCSACMSGSYSFSVWDQQTLCSLSIQYSSVETYATVQSP